MTMRKHLVSLCALSTLVSLRSALAADDLPKPLAFARYEKMMNRSPFAVATAVAPAPVAPNFAKDLYIANAARLTDEGVVTLASATDKNMKEYLSTKSPNGHGYAISNIQWSDRVGGTKVTISKDGQFATLTFNQALLNQPLTVNPLPQQLQQQPVPPLPGQPATGTASLVVPNNPNPIKPAPIPTLPTPPPRVRGMIQRNPANVPVPTPEPEDDDE